MLNKKLTLTTAILSLSLLLMAANANDTVPPRAFLYTGSTDLSAIMNELLRPDIGGVQVVYNWKELEPHKGTYDFSDIENDLAITEKLHKKLFIQIQDRFFEPRARNIPLYLQRDPVYGGGLVPQSDNPGQGKPPGHGWVAMQWNSHLRFRYQQLLKALAERFDGKVYGVNLPETAVDIDPDHAPGGFTCQKYFDAEIENMNYARSVFHKSYVVQYVNFFPCDWGDSRHYIERLFADAAAHHIGLGGPDVVPYRRGQMKNSYPFFHEYRGKLPLVAMAVQEPTLTYINPNTNKRFTKNEFVDFAQNYLGANIIFWSTISPWLQSK